MEGLQSQAIPTALTADQLSLLEQVYQDSLERIPNIQAFRTTDKNKLIDTLKTSNFWGTGTNGLNTTGEKILSMSLARTDDFNTYLTSWFTSDVGVVATKDQIKNSHSLSIHSQTISVSDSLYIMVWGYTWQSVYHQWSNEWPLCKRRSKIALRSKSISEIHVETMKVKQFKCTNGLYEDDASHVETTSCPNGCSNEYVSVKRLRLSHLICLRLALSIALYQSGCLRTPAILNCFFIIIAGDDDATFPNRSPENHEWWSCE